MNTTNISYDTHILKTAIDNHLDHTLPSDANKALHSIEYEIDHLVWNIATSIYHQSGYRVDFSLVRDLANARIESLKMLVAKRTAEEFKKEEEVLKAKKIAELESQRKAEDKMSIAFLKIRRIIADHLEIEENLVTLDSDVIQDLGADELDATELAMAIEDEFNIEEIPYDISLCHIRNLLNFVCTNI